MEEEAAPLWKTDALDSEVVRANFRHVVRWGFWVGAALTLLYAVVFLVLGQSAWRWNVVLALLLAWLTRYATVKRSFAVFLAALMCGVVALIINSSVLTLSFGRGSAFQFVLLSLLPFVAVSGRIGPRTKWVMALAFGAYVITLDKLSAGVVDALPAGPSELLRMMNWALLVLVLIGLTHHYFTLAARQQALLHAQATTDSLTGLMNRRQLIESGEFYVKQCRRQGQPLSVVLCDLDHFKSINDRFGHAAGDTVLKQAAEVFRQGVRDTDAAGRWGGEEFMLLLPAADADGAMALAHRVCEALATTPIVVHGTRLDVTVTMGIATLGPDESLDAAIARADRSLYQGKAEGRNRAFFSTALT